MIDNKEGMKIMTDKKCDKDKFEYARAYILPQKYNAFNKKQEYYFICNILVKKDM